MNGHQRAWRVFPAGSDETDAHRQGRYMVMVTSTQPCMGRFCLERLPEVPLSYLPFFNPSRDPQFPSSHVRHSRPRQGVHPGPLASAWPSHLAVYVSVQESWQAVLSFTCLPLRGLEHKPVCPNQCFHWWVREPLLDWLLLWQVDLHHRETIHIQDTLTTYM